ncbi:MAG TPA: hypothetical protein VEG84_10245, partial [Thermoanaerobaculia bacterium]|nr:hypothetical protein [Thermoanaerobaculia bacterium]
MPETTPAAAPPRTPTPSVIAVSDIPGEAVAFEALRREIARRLIPGGELLEASRQVADVETRVRQALARRAFAAPEEVQLVELQDLESELREVDAASSRLDALLTTR